MRAVAAILLLVILAVIIYSAAMLILSLIHKHEQRVARWVVRPRTESGQQVIYLVRGSERLEFWRQGMDQAIDDDTFETQLIGAEQRCEVLNGFERRTLSS